MATRATSSLVALEARKNSRDLPSIWGQPLGDVGHHDWVDVLRLRIFGWCGGTYAREEQVVVCVVDPDGDIRAVAEARFPP
jgi:hypothetical protein